MNVPRNLRYILLALACLTVVAVAEVVAPRPVDWTPSFVHHDTRPYGSRIVYDQLPALFGGDAVDVADAPVYQTLDDGRAAPPGYIFITAEFAPDPAEARMLLDYVREGGHLFVAADAFSGALADSLGVRLSPLAGPPVPGRDSVGLHFTHPDLRTEEGYGYRSDVLVRRITGVDSTTRQVLGEDAVGRTTFVRVRAGNGAFYLSTTPRAFTNYYMLREGTDEYVYKALSHLPEAPVWWDAYYKPVRTHATTPLRFVLAQPALRWAYVAGLVAILLFVTSKARRRQRAIPVIEPPENTTRAFVETVGHLYYHHGDDADLARKKVTYFYDYLRNRLNVAADAEDEDLVAEVTERSGVPRADVADVFTAIRQVEGRDAVSRDELLHLTTRIDTFYQRSAR